LQGLLTLNFSGETMQFIGREEDAYGNVFGIAHDGRKYLTEVMKNGVRMSLPQPKLIQPNIQQQSYSYGTQKTPQYNYGTQNHAMNGASSLDSVQYDELGKPITGGSTQRYEKEVVEKVVEVDNKVYTVVPLYNNVPEFSTTTVEKEDILKLKIRGNTRCICYGEDEVTLEVEMNSIVMTWLSKLSRGEKHSIVPKRIDATVDVLIAERISSIMPSLSFGSLLEDSNELLEAFESPDFEADKLTFCGYLSDIIAMNNKSSYKKGEVFKVKSITMLLHTDIQEVKDEVMSIDTLSTLDIPTDSALFTVLDALSVVESYIRVNNRLFTITHGKKIRIKYID